MSASPVARQAVSQAIPVTRRVLVNHESELPNDLSSTPGGSLFSTTPGGTRVYYDRNFMLSMRLSALARTPPPNLPVIKGVTVPDDRPKDVIQEEEENCKDSDDEEEVTRRREASERLRSSSAAASNDDLSSSPPKDDDSQFQLEL